MYNNRNGNKPFLNAELQISKKFFVSFTMEGWYSSDPRNINSKSLEFYKSKFCPLFGQFNDQFIACLIQKI